MSITWRISDASSAELLCRLPLLIPNVDDLVEVAANGDGGVVGAVGSFPDGLGPFGQWLGLVQLSQVLEQHGEVIQVGGNFRMVGAISGLVNGQDPFGQWSAWFSCPKS